ncbi:TPA: hypothetical protein HA239_03500 [Candidatus Woesearchaeota archaeon]|nr:hypothetical protein QT06_C0001G0884 [archaeon GW2011_AR15]MBS3103337.1 hypothetical protein [Candidatus Woesearchaeota archaeon]HIH41455.1 hypothetical protein [Candidatus Woesearchaeota archaeon]
MYYEIERTDGLRIITGENDKVIYTFLGYTEDNRIDKFPDMKEIRGQPRVDTKGEISTLRLSGILDINLAKDDDFNHSDSPLLQMGSVYVSPAKRAYSIEHIEYDQYAIKHRAGKPAGKYERHSDALLLLFEVLGIPIEEEFIDKQVIVSDGIHDISEYLIPGRPASVDVRYKYSNGEELAEYIEPRWGFQPKAGSWFKPKLIEQATTITYFDEYNKR